MANMRQSSPHRLLQCLGQTFPIKAWHSGWSLGILLNARQSLPAEPACHLFLHLFKRCLLGSGHSKMGNTEEVP